MGFLLLFYVLSLNGFTIPTWVWVLLWIGYFAGVILRILKEK